MSRRLPQFNKPSKNGSKTPTVPIDSSDRRLENLNPAKPENRIKAYKDAIAKLDAQIKRLEPNFVGVNDLASRLGVFTEFGFLEYPAAKAKLESLRREKSVQELRLRTYKSSLNPSRETKKPKGDKNNSKKPPATSDTPVAETPPATPGVPPVIYNAGAVKDIYIQETRSLFKSQVDSKGYARDGGVGIDRFVHAGPPSSVIDAIDLWKNSTASKGMIQTWSPSGSKPQYVMDDMFTTLSGTKSFQRYGFQFLYNPTDITMNYGGVPDIDPSMMSSGTEDYLLSNPSVYRSTINFSILLNRMSDLQYLGPGGKLKGVGGVPIGPENEAAAISKLYNGKLPTGKDLKKIYNRGTMYDVEFLLQTMFSYSPLATELRNKTSDIGYLGAFPVEMHLGNKLRYVVIIDNIEVRHAIFDHRMVPMYTTVTISARRIPDYLNSAVTDASISGTITPGATGTVTNPVVPGGGSLLGGRGLL
jgi:hypothetical protein